MGGLNKGVRRRNPPRSCHQQRALATTGSCQLPCICAVRPARPRSSRCSKPLTMRTARLQERNNTVQATNAFAATSSPQAAPGCLALLPPPGPCPESCCQSPACYCATPCCALLYCAPSIVTETCLVWGLAAPFSAGQCIAQRAHRPRATAAGKCSLHAIRARAAAARLGHHGLRPSAPPACCRPAWAPHLPLVRAQALSGHDNMQQQCLAGYLPSVALCPPWPSRAAPSCCSCLPCAQPGPSTYLALLLWP
jgi:hypothetical protein